jgi:hypothetical protein
MRMEVTSKSTLYSVFESKSAQMESIVVQHELNYCGLYFLLQRVGSWQNDVNICILIAYSLRLFPSDSQYKYIILGFTQEKYKYSIIFH